MKVSCLNPFIREVPQVVDDLGFPIKQIFPCGKCPVCRSSDAKDWMLRLTIESENSINSKFLTLTYNEKNIVRNGSVAVLNPRDLQLFIKRLRSRLARQYPDFPKLRFFAVGEYGGNTCRPHYHAILFNLPTDNCVRKIIEESWNKGFITLSAINSKRIAYVANYSLFSFLFSDDKNSEIPSPFRVMSRRPGIGYQYVTDNRFRDINLTGKTFIRHRGFSYRFPRFYKERFFITEEDRLKLSTILNERRQSDIDVYESLYGEIDKERLLAGLPTMMEGFEDKYVDYLKKKFIIHKLHRKL